MKNLFIILFAAVLFMACNNSGEKTETNDDTVTIVAFPYWEATDTGRLAVIRHESGGPAVPSADSIISFLNQRFPNVQLALLRASNDTVYVKIPEPTYLTQQMGSSGPRTFFAEAVYNLTEIAGIRFVNFDFEEGDHAAPGTMSRDSFRED